MFALAWQIEKRGHSKANQRIVELTELRKSDEARFEAAQAQAEAQAKANVARVQSEQQRITSNVQSDYARELAALRARFLRASTAHPGQPKGAAVPPGSAAPGG